MDVINRDAALPLVTKDGLIIREILAHRNSGMRNQSLAAAVVALGATTQAHYHPVFRRRFTTNLPDAESCGLAMTSER